MASNEEKTLAVNVINVVEEIKNQNQGQNLENIQKKCSTKFGWTEDDTQAALKAAIEQNLLREIMYKKKVSYRLNTPNLVIIRDNDKPEVESATVEGVDEHSAEQNDIPEFKKHIWDVVAKLQVEMQGLKDSVDYQWMDPPRDQQDVHNLYERLIGCLEERVKTLEKELNSKQQIIETILKQQDARCHTQQADAIQHLKVQPSESVQMQIQSPHEKTSNQGKAKKTKVK